jgi:hypothetical protein
LNRSVSARSVEPEIAGSRPPRLTVARLNRTLRRETLRPPLYAAVLIGPHRLARPDRVARAKRNRASLAPNVGTVGSGSEIRGKITHQQLSFARCEALDLKS